MKTLSILALLTLVLAPESAFAIHKSYVAGQVIDSSDRGIYEAHGENCAYRHYHGELNGVADPVPDGCGHGEVKLIAHGDGDGETIPPPPKKGLWDSFVSWIKSFNTQENKDTVMNVIDVAAEANGIPPPGTVSDTVDIVKDATPAIMEKTEGIKEYRESVSPEEDTLGIYRKPDAGLEEGSLSQKFFSWLNNLLK